MPWDLARHLEFIPSASADIRRFEAKYNQKEVDIRGASPIDTTPKIDIYMLHADASVPYRSLGQWVHQILPPLHRIQVFLLMVSRLGSLRV